MSIKELPSKVNPVKLCKSGHEEGTILSGKLRLKDLANLPDDLRQKDADIDIFLKFFMDEEGYCCISGEISGDINMKCQNCLKPMILHIKAPIFVSPVTSDEESKRLPARFEPLLVPHNDIELTEWIAEELYLALPLVPRHETRCFDSGNIENP